MSLAALGACAAQRPSLCVPNDFGMDQGLKTLAAKAGDTWRETAEQNRTTGLEKLSGVTLRIALAKTAEKYVDSYTQSVGNVPLFELGEIVEAAFRGGVLTDGFGWALLKSAFASCAKVDDPVVAAKLLAGFERGLAGVRRVAAAYGVRAIALCALRADLVAMRMAIPLKNRFWLAMRF